MNHIKIVALLLGCLVVAGIVDSSRAGAQTWNAVNQYQLVTGNTTLTTANLIEVNLTAGNSTLLLNSTVPTGTPVDVFIGPNAGATNSTSINATSGTVAGSTKTAATAQAHYRFVFDGTNWIGG